MVELNRQDDFLQMPNEPSVEVPSLPMPAKEAAPRPSLDEIFGDRFSKGSAASPSVQTATRPSLDEIFNSEAAPQAPVAGGEKPERDTYDKVTETLAAPTDILGTGIAQGQNTLNKAVAGGLRIAGEGYSPNMEHFYAPLEVLKFGLSRISAGVDSLLSYDHDPMDFKSNSFLTDVANDLSRKSTDLGGQYEKNLAPYKTTTAGKIGTDIAAGAVQMPFYIGSLMMAGPIGPATMMGGSSFEDTYGEAMKSGKSHDEAFNIAGGVGAVQAGLNSVYIGKLLSIAEDTTKPIINRVLTQAVNAAIFNTVGTGSTTAILNQTGVRNQSTYDQVKDVLYSVAVGTPAAVIGGAPFMKAHIPSEPPSGGGEGVAPGGENVKMNPVSAFVTTEQLNTHVSDRIAELKNSILTKEKKAELDFLEKHKDNPDKLAEAYNVAIHEPEVIAQDAARKKLEDLGVKNPDKVLEAVPEIRESLKNAIVETVHSDNVKAKENPEMVNKTFDTIQAMKDGNFDNVSELVDNHGGLTPKVSAILERYKNRVPIPPEGVHYTELKPDTEAFKSAQEVEAQYGYKLEPYPKPETEVKVEGKEPEMTTQEVYSEKEKAAKPVDKHKTAVEKALSEGKEVPPEVLDDYPDLVEKQKEKNASKKAVGSKAQMPILRDIKKQGVRIGSPLAAELENIGITQQTLPGLFRKEGGMSDVDTFIASEWGYNEYHSHGDDNGYVDRQHVLDSIENEFRNFQSGVKKTVAHDYEDELYKTANSYGIDVNNKTIDQIKSELSQKASSEEFTNEVLARQEDELAHYEEFEKLEKEWLGNRGDAWEPKEVTTPTLEELEHDWKQEESIGTPLSGDKNLGESGRTGATEEISATGGKQISNDANNARNASDGDQTVIPGAERISDRELAERKMQGGSKAKVAQKPADEGLFDTESRKQIDLFGKKEEAKTNPQLPQKLRGAKPRYRYGPKEFELAFDSDIDKSLYTVSGKGQSDSHAEYKAFLKANGYNDASIATEGQKLRDNIKVLAKDAEPGTLNIKSKGDVERMTEDKALESKYGHPESMALPLLGRLDSKLEGIFGDRAQTEKMSDEQFSALEDYKRRVEAARDKMMSDSQRGAVDLTGLLKKIREKRKEPWEMTAEDYANIGNPKFTGKSKIFQPAKMSVDAEAMAAILREGKGESTRDTAQVIEKLNRYAKIVNALEPKEQLQLIDYMENRSNDMGVKLPDPALQVIADTYRDIYQSVEEAIKTQFPDAKMREDYFTHQYEDPKAAAKFFSDFIAKQGSGKNLRARAFPTLKEAMEFGLKPRTTNPSEIVGTYVANMNNFLSTHRTLERMQQTGIAKYYNKGEQPTGWAPLEGNLAKETDVVVMSDSGDPTLVPGKQLYAPENAARVYNNDISKGFGDPYAGAAEALQKSSNFATKISLLGPMHHFSTVTMGSMASDVARGVGLLAKGEIGEGAKAIGQGLTPGLSPAKNISVGRKVQEQYLGIDNHGPAYEKIVALGEAANVFHATQQEYWKAGPAKDFVDSFKAGTLKSELKGAVEKVKDKPVMGTLEVIANGISKTADTISKPLFDYYVPLIKKGAFFSEMHNWLDKNPDASWEQQKAAAREIGDSMDNRFGEMMRDNLFWKKTTQQTLQATFLSYSWVVGGLRMLKGGSDAVSNLIRGRKMTADSKYLFGMAMTYAVYNAMMTYLHTGKYTDDWDEKDLYSYRTGGKTMQGKHERAILPGHTTEYLHYLHDGIGELKNKVSPGLKLLDALITNEDFRGLPVTNENNSWFSKERWGDYAKFALEGVEPISEKTLRKGRKKGSKISTLEQVLAVRPAPEFVTNPEGYESKAKIRNEKEYRRKLRSDQRIESQYEPSPDNE